MNQPVPTVSMKIQNQEFGCLIYDIPVSASKVYEKIRKVLRRTAVPLNLSVYLIPWALRDQVEKLLREHLTHDCDIKFIKFDTSSKEDLTKQVEKGMLGLVTAIYRRINDRASAVRKQSELQKYDYKYDIAKRIEDVETLTAIYGLTQDIQDALEAVKKLYQIEVHSL
jgi:hypothetical protein